MTSEGCDPVRPTARRREPARRGASRGAAAPRSLRRRIWTALLVAMGVSIAGAALGQDAATAALEARVDALARAFMLQEGVQDAVLAVVDGDRTILRAYGPNGAPEERPDARRFEIGSITKLFTWVAVMMLVEEGRLDLEADVAAYLPDLPMPGEAPLTLAQLMSHRAGFAESFEIFEDRIAALPRAEALRAGAPEQAFPRGELTSYSNWGAAVVGHVVEVVSGEPWEEFVRDRILDPLGMADTTTAERLRDPGQPPLAPSYRVQDGVARPAYRVDIGAFGPAGAMATTPGDMARFLRFLLSDGTVEDARLLSSGTMARMRTRLFDDRAAGADMAHGFQSKPRFGTTVYGHGGGLNEFVSNLVFVPEIGAGVFVSQNGGTGASLPLLLPDLVLEHLAAAAGLAAPPREAVPDAALRAAEAAGRYVPNRRTVSGPTQILAALGPLVVTAAPGGDLLVPSPKIGTVARYAPVAPDVWEDALGDRMVLIRDGAGRPLRLADPTGAHTYDRARGLADPLWLALGFGAALLLALTTGAGLLWRHGLDGRSRIGTLAAAAQAGGALSVAALTGAAVAAALAATRLGAQFLFDQPQPALTGLLLAADLVAVAAALLVAAAFLALRAPGWGVLRRSHLMAFAAALAFLAVLLVRWGLAFGGAI